MLKHCTRPFSLQQTVRNQHCFLNKPKERSKRSLLFFINFFSLFYKCADPENPIQAQIILPDLKPKYRHSIIFFESGLILYCKRIFCQQFFYRQREREKKREGDVNQRWRPRLMVEIYLSATQISLLSSARARPWGTLKLYGPWNRLNINIWEKRKSLLICKYSTVYWHYSYKKGVKKKLKREKG